MAIRSRNDLLRAIEKLPPNITFFRRSYKTGWLHWLSNYEDLSRTTPDRSAEFIYNALNVPEWIVWLAAASGIDRQLVQAATDSIDRQEFRQTQAAAVRRILLWSLMAKHLENPKIDDAESYDDIALDLDAIYRSREKETTKQTLIEARLGQGQFRSKVAKRWNNQCAVTGCAIVELLRASHIKPWSKCSDSDRLNPANGILLAAHLDALFDCGLISFADDGTMRVSNEVSDDLKPFQLPDRLRREPTKDERRFLAYHRRHVFAP
jgi:predicted restriction endonuclease